MFTLEDEKMIVETYWWFTRM